VVRWESFDPADYDITFNDEKLAAHGISRYDVMEVLGNGFQSFATSARWTGTASWDAPTREGRSN
jgi:hypothetical protein